MKKKIKIFLILFFLFSASDLRCNEANPRIEPETGSKLVKSKFRSATAKDFIIVTANDYATKVGYEILKKGGTVVDAAVTIQLMLGLVEPQSSGIGGGTFATLYHKDSKKVFSYEGREKAPKEIKENIFLNKNLKPKKFFDAAIGGTSVGVPATLKTLHQMHKDFGKLEWKDLVLPVIQFSESGFIPSNRLKDSLEKEKFLFELYPNSIFKKIKLFPKQKFKNINYTETLKVISKNIDDFYKGELAKKIVNEVKSSKTNPGYLNLVDLGNYNLKKNSSLCHRLKNGYLICGPNLPSSGTICILQALILFESIYWEKFKLRDNINYNLNDVLDILNFIYFFRDSNLADDEFELINTNKFFDEDFLRNEFELHKKNISEKNVKNFKEIFNSTSHFSLVDKYKNVLSVTSSIESSFGSRLFVEGFFLNNQLTDFSFRIRDALGNPKKNRPEGGKRPISSMSPLIIFDKKNNFFLTIGSPGGKAIISYVFKVLLDLLYLNLEPMSSINSPNFIRINGKTFLENDQQNKTLIKKGIVRSLTSGLAVIKKEKNNFSGFADYRRDGSVRGD